MTKRDLEAMMKSWRKATYILLPLTIVLFVAIAYLPEKQDSLLFFSGWATATLTCVGAWYSWHMWQRLQVEHEQQRHRAPHEDIDGHELSPWLREQVRPKKADREG